MLVELKTQTKTTSYPASIPTFERNEEKKCGKIDLAIIPN